MAKMRFLVIWINQKQSFKIAKKYCDISYTQRDFEQKNFIGSGFEGAPKLLKAFFSRLFLWQNYETLEVPCNSGSFLSTDLKFGTFIAK